MSLETTVLLLEADALPESLEEQLVKRDVFVEQATSTTVLQVVPVVVPDLIVQAGDAELSPVLEALEDEKTPPPLVVIADRATIRKLRAEKHDAVKALIPKDLPIAAIAHRLSTMARRSAEGRPLEMTQRRQSAKAQSGTKSPPPQVAASERGSLAPTPPAVTKNVKIVDPVKEQEDREKKALEAAEAQERAVAEARKKKASAAEATKKAAKKREAEIERQALERKKRLENKHRAATVPRPTAAQAPQNTQSELNALDDLFPTEDPTAVVPAPHLAADIDEEAEEHEMTTQAVDISAFAPTLDAQAKRNSTPPEGTPKANEPKPSAAPPRATPKSAPPKAKSAPPKAKSAPPKAQSTPPDSEPPQSAVPSKATFDSVKKKDELSVIAPLPVDMRMELAPQTSNLPAIRLALLDTDLTRADAVSASLREVGMKIHPITPDTTKTRWPMLRRFAPQGLVVDEKSMARGASEWVETFRGDPFLRHVPVILVRFSRLFDEDAGEVTLDPLLHLIEHLGREEFALLEKLGPGRQVDLWLSQVAPYRLIEMLTKEDRNTRLDCKSRDERMVWHLGPGYAGKGKLAELKTNEPRQRLSPEDAMAWLLSHEDCQVAVHEHSEPLAHASESTDAEELLRELTDVIAAPTRHESVRPASPSRVMKAPSIHPGPAPAASSKGSESVATLSSSALMSEAASLPQGMVPTQPGEVPAPSVAQPATLASPGTKGPAAPHKPLISESRKAQLKRAVSQGGAAIVGWYGAYRERFSSLIAPLEGKVPPKLLAHGHWLAPVLLFLIFFLIISASIGSDEPQVAAKPQETAPEKAAPAPTKPAPKKEAPKKEAEPKENKEKEPEPEEEKEEEPSEGELWKVAPDSKLPTCEERLGASAPKEEDHIKSVGYLKQARKLLMVGKTEEAIENMCLAGLFNPGGKASEGLAEYYLGQRSLEEAERWIKASLKAAPESRKSRELLGDIENQKGNPEEARKLLLDTMMLSGDETKKMALTARKLRQDAKKARKGGDLPRAERELRRAVILTPEDAVVAAELGEILLRRKAARAAGAWAGRALKLDPNYSVAMLLAARAAEAQGDKDQARSFYEMVPIGDPFHKEAQRRRSRL